MKKTSYILCFLSLVALLSSCIKTKKGVVEYKSTSSNPSFPVEYNYGAFVADAADLPFTEGQVYIENKPDYYISYQFVYWSDESVKSLGYTSSSGNASEYFGKLWDTFFNKDGSNIPGKNGYWQSEGPSSGGNGGGNGNCTSSYESPINNSDPQLDAYCGQAYALRCMDGKPLSDPQVQQTCNIYNQMKEPGVPDCPYCK